MDTMDEIKVITTCGKQILKSKCKCKHINNECHKLGDVNKENLGDCYKIKP